MMTSVHATPDAHGQELAARIVALRKGFGRGEGVLKKSFIAGGVRAQHIAQIEDEAQVVRLGCGF